MTPQPNPTAPTRNLSPSGWRARLVFDPAVSERWPVVPGTQITAWDAYVSIELNTQPIGVFVERHHGRVDHLGVVDLLKAAEELIARARARREPLPELDRPH